jgi:hypothetical protein
MFQPVSGCPFAAFGAQDGAIARRRLRKRRKRPKTAIEIDFISI